MISRPLLAVVGSVVTFALLIENAGLIPAVILTVMVAACGSREISRREALLLAVCLAVAMAALFVAALSQPFTLIRTW